jgi:hypothetical protein
VGLWHLEELRNDLEQRGWRVSEHPGDDHSISGSWELERSTNRPRLWIDFEGLDDLNCLPMPQSYGCSVRSDRLICLYFRKQRSRAIWDRELTGFVAALDRIDLSRVEE